MQTDLVDLFLLGKLVALDFRENVSDELTLPLYRESIYQVYFTDRCVDVFPIESVSASLRRTGSHPQAVFSTPHT